ncbi:hypothetical protein D3C85_445970 [compost metagenome]
MFYFLLLFLLRQNHDLKLLQSAHSRLEFYLEILLQFFQQMKTNLLVNMKIVLLTFSYMQLSQV